MMYPLRQRRTSPVKSAFDADVVVSAMSAHQRWTDTAGVDDSLLRELVKTMAAGGRATLVEMCFQNGV